MATAMQRKRNPQDPNEPAALETPAQAAPQAAEPKIVMPTKESKEFTLLDGRRITMQRPNGVYSIAMYRIMGEDPTGGVLTAMYRGVFHLRAINGAEIMPPTSKAEFDMIAGQLGDEGLEEVGALFLQHFIPKVEEVRPL